MPETKRDRELYKLHAASLAHLDRGTLAVALEQALQQAARDCIDRPTDDRARTVTVTISLKPKPEYDEETRSVEIVGAEGQYKVRCAVPDRESKPLDFGLTSDGSLIFNENVPDNHRQRSFFAEEGETNDNDS
jgi:hypothetical protein